MSLCSPNPNITGWAVALTCYISHSAKHRKMADFDPSGAKTPEPISMKLGMVDYIQDPTPHDIFGEGSATWVVWANIDIGNKLTIAQTAQKSSKCLVGRLV